MKITKKEVYSIKRPRSVIIGDPLYFKTEKGERLKKLTVNYYPSSGDKAVISLRQIQEDFFLINTLTMYFAPLKMMDLYLKDEILKIQDIKEKQMPVDDARYLINVDDRSQEIYTGEDGYWGMCTELSHKNINNEVFKDGVMIQMSMPQSIDFDEMKRLSEYFFEDMKFMRDKSMEVELKDKNKSR